MNNRQLEYERSLFELRIFHFRASQFLLTNRHSPHSLASVKDMHVEMVFHLNLYRQRIWDLQLAGQGRSFYVDGHKVRSFAQDDTAEHDFDEL